jgi:hypothetical protein
MCRILFTVTPEPVGGKFADMGRPYRAALGGYVYHMLNRANGGPAPGAWLE